MVAAVAACSSGDDATAPTTTSTTAPPDPTRLDQVQMVGTHNSYHVQPAPELFALLAQFDRELAASFEYTHGPLDDQLDAGMRQLELDVFADPEGGHYADPAGQRLAPGDPPPDPDGELRQPGFKVLHVQDVDFRTRCRTFTGCLEVVDAWSDDHPAHAPVLILVEVKEGAIPDPLALGFVVPHTITAAHLDALDAEIRTVFDEDELLTPDDLRGEHPTLLDAVTIDGWPRLDDVRGQVVFALDNTGSIRDLYLGGHPNLEDRVLFVSSEPPEPTAAFVKLNDPIADGARIAELVADGFIVRTRADADTIEARTGDITRREAAFASGAQYVSTDYEEPSPFGTGYVVELPGGGELRCNPVSIPAPRAFVRCERSLSER